MAGMDPMRFLESENETEMLIMAAIADRKRDMQREHDENVAQMTANAVAKTLLGKG